MHLGDLQQSFLDKKKNKTKQKTVVNKKHDWALYVNVCFEWFWVYGACIGYRISTNLMICNKTVCKV